MSKKGVSEIVSYTLLIVIAISMAVLVFAYLKIFVPKDKPECKDGINLIIEWVNCSFPQQKLEIIFQNNGRFRVDRAFMRMGPNENFRKIIKQANPLTLKSLTQEFVLPQESTIKITNIDVSEIVTVPGTYTLEVQPAIFTKEGNTNPNTLGICPAFTQKISCS